MKSIIEQRKTVKSIIEKSLVNKFIKIIQHTDTTLVGIEGVVVQDTHNMLMIECKKKSVFISKRTAIIQISIPNGVVRINGLLLLGSIKRRNKQKLRTW